MGAKISVRVSAYLRLGCMRAEGETGSRSHLDISSGFRGEELFSQSLAQIDATT